MGESPSDPWRKERDELVDREIAAGGSVTNPDVIRAMREVPRHEFVPPDEVAHSYADHPLAIGYGQTISQPSLVAWMTQAIDPQPSDRILEIGTGSGYQAAILSRLAGEVYSIEIIPALAATARANLLRTGCNNVHVRDGDAWFGWPEAAPFDAVIVACCPKAIPPALLGQLRDGGRIAIPVGTLDNQSLLVLQKDGEDIRELKTLPVRFVPMTGEAGK